MPGFMPITDPIPDAQHQRDRPAAARDQRSSPRNSNEGSVLITGARVPGASVQARRSEGPRVDHQIESGGVGAG